MKLTPSYLVVENSVQWHPLKIAGATGKAWIKVFGRDPATQATAAMIKYQKGFTAPATTAQVYSDNLFLSGKLAEGQHTFGKYGYYYRPPGTAIGAITALEDTVKFVITGGLHEKCDKTPVIVEDCEKAATEASYMGDAWAIKKLRWDKKPTACCYSRSASRPASSTKAGPGRTRTSKKLFFWSTALSRHWTGWRRLAATFATTRPATSIVHRAVVMAARTTRRANCS